MHPARLMRTGLTGFSPSTGAALMDRIPQFLSHTTKRRKLRVQVRPIADENEEGVVAALVHPCEP